MMHNISAFDHNTQYAIVKKELCDEEMFGPEQPRQIPMPDALFGKEVYMGKPEDLDLDALGGWLKESLDPLAKAAVPNTLPAASLASMSDDMLRSQLEQLLQESQRRNMPNLKPVVSVSVEFNSAVVEKQWQEFRVAKDCDLHGGHSRFTTDLASKRYGGHLMSLTNYQMAKGEYNCPMCSKQVPLNPSGKRCKDKKGMCKPCNRGYWQHPKDGFTYKWCQGCHKWEHVSCFSPVTASKCQDEQAKAATEKRARDEKKRQKQNPAKRVRVCEDLPRSLPSV
jgi:hypothetical protein